MRKLRDQILENYFIGELFIPKRREMIETLLMEADRIDRENYWTALHYLEAKELKKERKKMKKEARDLIRKIREMGEVADIMYKRFIENQEFYE